MKRILLSLALAMATLSPAAVFGNSFRGKCEPLMRAGWVGLANVKDISVRRQIADILVRAQTERSAHHFEACVNMVREALQIIDKNS